MAEPTTDPDAADPPRTPALEAPDAPDAPEAPDAPSFEPEPAPASPAPAPPAPPRGYGIGLSFRVLLTAGLIVAAVLPLAAFGGIVVAARLYSDSRIVGPLLIASIVAAAFFGLLAAAVAVAALTAPLRRITTAVERVAAGEPSPPIHLTGDDELARLAESHNRIAAEAARRNRELGALLEAIAGYNPAGGVEALNSRAESRPAADACRRSSRQRHPRRPNRPSAGDSGLGARRPGSARPIRQRGGRGSSQRRAVRSD
jgi:HAMP domain-containing protein